MTAIPKQLAGLRDKLAFKTFKELCPHIPDHVVFLAHGNKSQTLEAVKIGFNAAIQALSEGVEDKLVAARFWSKVSVLRKNECWKWNSSIRPNGYGEISVNNKSVSAHVFAFEFIQGKVLEGLWIDHICRNRLCVNPEHLRAVTPRVNALENSESLSAKNSVKTHCKNGHEFNAENTVLRVPSSGISKIPYRICKKCRSITNKKRFE